MQITKVSVASLLPLVFVFGFCPISTAGQSGVSPASALRRGFVTPPAEAKLRCYWWWLNGNTTEETITHDLTEMSKKGFGGVLLVDANGSNQAGNDNVPAGPMYGSPAWTNLYVHALKVAAALHLEVTLNITSGWNLGGPNVTPEQASKLLTWSRVTVGAKGFDGQLPAPPMKNGFYRQVAVLAYPLAHGAALAGDAGNSRAAVRDLHIKAAEDEMKNFSMPHTEGLMEDVAPTPGEEDSDLSGEVNITAQVTADGHLKWTPPTAGTWEVLRVGYTDSDAKVSTSSGAWQGLAIDYMDHAAFDTFWTHHVEPLLTVSRPYLKTTLVNLATDSWELGGTNWTGRFAAEFRRRRGYDPVPYLPVVAGRIVKDRATSNQFLNDLRRTVGDLITDHYDHFAERAKVYGLGIECESGGPHGAPIDGLETFRSSAVPQTEYWAQSVEHRSTDEDRYFTKEAASAANIYGKKFVAQEGMTSIGPQWSESLATDLKPSFDQGLTEGMNRLVWHEFTSSPASFGLPGIEYFAGTHIDPNITWWKQSDEFFRYLNRSQFMMQQGHSFDDILYFYGDEVPNFARLKHDDPAKVLPGYDYDVTDEDALLRRLTIRNGKISTPAGNQYRLVMLPTSGRLSLASLERIVAYAEQGGNIAGAEPIGPIGVVDAATANSYEAIKRAVWAGCVEKVHSYGKGRVFCNSNGREVLAALKTAPDFEGNPEMFDYIHRVAGGADIYFVRNRTAQVVNEVVRFRSAGREPEFWNAVDGSMTTELHYSQQAGTTAMPLHLAPYGSVFVVFQRTAGLHVTQVLKDGAAREEVGVSRVGVQGMTLHAVPGAYELRLSDGRTVTSTVAMATGEVLAPERWTISFQPERGAPEGAMPVKQFASWTESAEAGVRYFSGSATYRSEIKVERGTGNRFVLTLEDLHEIATVRINGKPAGTFWAMPYRLDVTDSLVEGKNTVELEVTNLWPNRLIGDAQPGVTKTYTQTNIRKYKADSPLLPSGLIGPVTLETIPASKVEMTKTATITR